MTADQLNQPRKREIGIRAFVQIDRIASAQFACLQDAIVPASPAIDDHRRWQTVIAETKCELEARLPRLANLKQHGSNCVYVADADVDFCEAIYGEVLANRAGAENARVFGKVGPPRAIVSGRISVDGFFRASMKAQVCLLVARQPKLMHRDRALCRQLNEAAGYALWSKRRRKPHMH